VGNSQKNPAGVLLTMAVVGGMFVVAGLPAYAVSVTEEAPQSLVSGTAQSLSVSYRADAGSSIRDAFSATTPEELAAKKAEEARVAAALASAAAFSTSGSSNYTYNFSGPRQPGDDYPWYGMEGMSPLRYYYGECVDFVAWRLNRDQGYYGPFRWDWGTMTPGGGSAASWTSAWHNKGWPVSSTPVAGAVAVIGYNHVAYVNSVNADGTVFLEEYNYGNYHQYSTRTVPAGAATYLYPPQ
jgi:surface antigen